MALKFGTNRGHKVHVVEPKTLDNTTSEAVCGTRIDTILSTTAAEAQLICGNCNRTHRYKELVG